jgi:Ser/Thr protein kinase RdoA (MazF antagonist)
MGGRSTTHLVEMRPDVVIKRYRSWGHEEPEREWRALQLLDEHATGVAPRPVTADLESVPPTVVMSRLDGGPLAGPVSAEQVDALAETITRVQEAIPRRVLADLPLRAGHPAELVQQVRMWSAALPRPDGDPLLTEAFDAAVTWVGRPRPEKTLAEPATSVFGTGDGNLANYLWDGSQIRLVDFEYSGRSDRSYELAEVVEHISVWENSTTGLTSMLEHFDLVPAEASRFRDCRRLLASFWLLRMLPDGQHEPRTSPDVLAAQANRLLALLN